VIKRQLPCADGRTFPEGVGKVFYRGMEKAAEFEADAHSTIDDRYAIGAVGACQLSEDVDMVSLAEECHLVSDHDAVIPLSRTQLVFADGGVDLYTVCQEAKDNGDAYKFIEVILGLTTLVKNLERRVGTVPHGDIKMQNIVMDEQSVCRLIDWGQGQHMSVILNQAQDRKLPRNRSELWPAFYMPPDLFAWVIGILDVQRRGYMSDTTAFEFEWVQHMLTKGSDEATADLALPRHIMFPAKYRQGIVDMYTRVKSMWAFPDSEGEADVPAAERFARHTSVDVYGMGIVYSEWAQCVREALSSDAAAAEDPTLLSLLKSLCSFIESRRHRLLEPNGFNRATMAEVVAMHLRLLKMITHAAEREEGKQGERRAGTRGGGDEREEEEEGGGA
jgi:hypothetical protein